MTAGTITTGSCHDVSKASHGTPQKTRGPRKIKIHRFFKWHKKSPTSLETPGNTISTDSLELPVLTFQDNLDQHNFSKAAQQLIAQENSLFEQNADPSPEDSAKLESDYKALLSAIWPVIKSSFTAGEQDKEILKEALSAIQLEEEQDRRWKKAEASGEGGIPAWRPLGCWSTHDTLIQELVKTRLENIEDVSGVDNLSSSLKKDIFGMGKRLKDDLLRVVRNVKFGYLQDFDICNLYARLYHKAFSAQLKSIAEFGLDVEDSIYVLSWVQDYYPNDVLKNNELKLHIRTEELGCLLPEEMMTPLKEQYLTYQESKMEEWGRTVLRKEEEVRNQPKEIDGCYSINMAIDYIQLFDGAVKSAASMLDNPDKTKRIAGQLNVFLTSYKAFLGEVLREKHGQATPTVKAHLAGLNEFKRYIMSNGDLFTTDVRQNCLSKVDGLIDSSHMYLTSIAHKQLKPKYSKLGTADWLSGNYLEVLDEIEKHIRHLKMKLNEECHEALLGQMHREVLAEYVKRLLKRKLKLSDRVQQETVAALVCRDSCRLDVLFTEAGSKEDWLKNILPKIAEVLRTQDLPFIQLELATLARDYPDLSSRHITALLNLKCNLSNKDISKIKQSVKETKNSIVPNENCQHFFSLVAVK